jgi:hypothetical protein
MAFSLAITTPLIFAAWVILKNFEMRGVKRR